MNRFAFTPLLLLSIGIGACLACGFIAAPEKRGSEASNELQEADSTWKETESIEKRADVGVLFVRASQAEDGSWNFDVTVSHPDAGWEDYADGWDVVLADGSVVKRNSTDPFTRHLLHPHVGEQPFTRSQSGLLISEDVTQVSVRAHDLVDGWAARRSTLI